MVNVKIKYLLGGKMENNMYKLRKAQAFEAKEVWAVRVSAIRSIREKFYSLSEMMKWSPQEMPDGFSQALIHHEWYVIELNGEIVASGFLDKAQGEIEAIFVKSEHQGKGFAKIILVHLIGLAREIGLAQLTLDATLNAEKFYQHCGFVYLSHSKHFSPNGVILDCVKMVKKI
jgi:GNAT superfamily N-acetyltransferase